MLVIRKPVKMHPYANMNMWVCIQESDYLIKLLKKDDLQHRGPAHVLSKKNMAEGSEVTPIEHTIKMTKWT